MQAKPLELDRLEIKLNPAVEYWSNYFFDVNTAEKQG